MISTASLWKLPVARPVTTASGAIWRGTFKLKTIWRGTIWRGTIWRGTICLGTVCLGMVWLATAPVDAEIRFVEVGAARGVLPYVMAPGPGGGVAAADFDGDGDVDFFVPNGETVADQLYRNLGNGHFEEIAATAGVASTERSRVALWFDYDGDHRLDLFVGGDCHEIPNALGCADFPTLRLYRQVEDGVFEDTTLEAGFLDDEIIHRDQHRSGMSAGDIDNDGDLDLFITIRGGLARLFANNGDGTFEDISATSGLGISEDYHQPMMHDWNGDGWLDIYANVDNTANRLWINQGDRSFVDLAPASGSNSAWNDMGLTFGDVDNDGDLDIYITNIQRLSRHNLLLRNDSTQGALQFTGLSSSGAENGGWGWGTTFFDVDKDSDFDLAATNGWILGVYATDPSRLFVNQGGPSITLVDAAGPAGLDDTYLGSSLIAADFDRDGDLDLLQTCNAFEQQDSQLRLLDNQSDGAIHDHGYLVVKPRMAGANHHAIGALVRIEIGDLRLMRLISAGTSYLGQEPAEAFFGTADATIVDRIIVEWPGGGQTVVENVATNQVVTVEAPGLFADGFESGDTSAW